MWPWAQAARGLADPNPTEPGPCKPPAHLTRGLAHPHPPAGNAQDAAIEQCIREYEGIAVWAVTRDATTGAIASVRFPEEDIALAV